MLTLGLEAPILLPSGTSELFLDLNMSSKRKWDQAAPDSKEDSPPKGQKVEESSTSKSATEAAAAAAAIAAKIAAQFASGSSGGLSADGVTRDLHDAEFTHDIDINDVRNRYVLTKGGTQQQVRTF